MDTKDFNKLLLCIPKKRLQKLIEADLEGRCIILPDPPHDNKRYVVLPMCAYCKDNYRFTAQCFSLKKCKAKIIEEISK